jgi:hypothetical protein
LISFPSHDQGGAYYGGYKDKVSDHWYEVPLQAKRYSSIGAAVKRLGLPDTIHDIDEFWKKYGSDAMKRNHILEDVLSIGDGDKSLNCFKNGRIDIIYENGDVVKFGGHEDALKRISDISSKTSKRKKESYSDYETPNIVPHEEGTDFWEGF